MYLKRTRTVKYFLATLVGAAIHAEWLVYLAQHFYWLKHDCLQNDATCTKILFIADPQIQGDNAAPPPLSYIIEWDSDRYLRSTFQAVFKFFKPDVLVFLGDLMNEGATGTMPEYYNYIKRLNKIFHLDNDVQRVWVPGENDIGGEHSSVFREQILVFDKAFSQPPVIRFHNITFYKVNVITSVFPQNTDIDSNFKIVVSHYPVLLRQEFSLQVENILHPHIYFCGHEHESKYMVQTNDRVQKDFTWFYSPRTVLDFAFSEGLQYEIYVPTCSYVMGASYIGYGAAVLDNNNRNLRYTVFWSSSRIPYLMLYLLLVIIFILYCLVFCAARFCNRKTNKSSTAEKSPLMQKI